MRCPNCLKNMAPISFDTIAVDHCDFCGGTFFDQNEINRITLNNAIALSKNQTNDSITGGEKNCPKDNTVLITYQSASVPQHVILLQCTKCNGIFAYANDLVEFKKAQEAKLHYYTAWRLPMPSIRTMLVFSFVITLSLSAVYYFAPFYKNPPIPTKADYDSCSIQITDSTNATVVYCKSEREYTANAVFYNEKTGEHITRVVNSKPSTAHFLTVSKDDIEQSPDVCVQFVLADSQASRTTPCVAFIKSL